MPWWQWLVDGAGAVLLLTLAYGLVLVVRRRWLGRAGGSFEVSVRSEPRPGGRGWVLGLGRYAGDSLQLFRVFSLSWRPLDTVVRGEVEYLGQRRPEGAEVHALYAGHVVVRCRRPADEVELAMAPGAVTGFLAWLEAAPPGWGPRPL